jgi:predicted flap endonuclease-1-like 5' DNA nuclease
MNSSSFALEPISQDQVLVTVALALVALLAVLTVIGMVWGARLKGKRRAAEAEEQQRIEELRADGVEVTNTADGIPPIVRGGDDAREDRHDAVPEQAPPPAPRLSPLRDETPADETPPEPPLAGEPIVAAAPLDASPASAAADAPRATADGSSGAQSITLLKGLGPKIATRLAELGITRVDQLAWLDDAEAAQLDAQLGVFTGRMERDRWREQARLLAQGDRAGYEAQFGKLG